MERIENRTFDELKIGDNASLVHTLTYKDIQVFAAMSGDVNPAHVDPVFARTICSIRSSRMACGVGH